MAKKEQQQGLKGFGKEGQINIIKIAILSTLIIGIGICAILFAEKADSKPQRCEQRCNYINFTFYRVDLVNTYLSANYYCYCMNAKGEPVNTGTIK